MKLPKSIKDSVSEVWKPLGCSTWAMAAGRGTMLWVLWVYDGGQTVLYQRWTLTPDFAAISGPPVIFCGHKTKGHLLFLGPARDQWRAKIERGWKPVAVD